MFAALLPLVIQAIPGAISAGTAIVNLISGIRTAAQQTGEWTPEAEAAFQAAILADAQTPAQQPQP